MTNLADLFKDRKIVVFAVPGAFTPTCSAKHLPGFIQQYDALKAKGFGAVTTEILEGSPTSVRVSLRIMEETRGIPDVIEAVSYPSPALADLMASEDSLEGVLAFAQKRKPQWRNR